jgi:hypothetical protein
VRRGNSTIEAAMFVPVFIVLLVGTAEIAKATYVYFQAHKELYQLARMLGTLQGGNLCDSSDPEIVNAKNFALTGSSEGGSPLITGLTPDIVTVRLERRDDSGEAAAECACTLEGCDASQGGRGPDFVVVSVPEGFAVPISIPYLVSQTIPLRLSVRVPYGGS